MRGTIPRELLRRVAAATYHQVWWPPVDVVRHAEHHLPVWDGDAYCDPDTRAPLPTWDEAVDQVDKPVHVARFGPQLHAEGVLRHAGNTLVATSGASTRELMQRMPGDLR